MIRGWLEKELEDYVWTNTQELAQFILPYHDNLVPNLIRLGRQIKCNSGIIDLLFYSGISLFVVELKAVRATSETLGQLIRYHSVVKNHVQSSMSDYVKGIKLAKMFLFMDKWIQIEYVIIAPSFDDLLLSTRGEPLRLITAEKSNGKFMLTCKRPLIDIFDNKDLKSALYPYMNQLITEHDMYESYHSEIE